MAALMCSALYSPGAHAQWEGPTVGGKFTNDPGYYNEGMMTIPARAAAHPNYSRLVLDWPSDVAYELKKPKDGVIVLSFKRRVLVDISDVRLAPETNFGYVEVISGLKDRLEIAISIPPKADYKAYKMGYKVVIDVNDVPGEKRGVFEVVPYKSAGTAAPVKKEGKAVPAALSADALTPPVLEASVPASSPATPVAVDWTQTQSFNTAMFTRYGYAYFVTDNVAGELPPSVTAGGKPFPTTAIKAEGGRAYRITLPEKTDHPVINARSERLGWSFIINSDTPPSARPAHIRLGKDSSGKQAVDIDMPRTSGTVRFSDPDTGETYTAMPSATSASLMDSVMSTPDFEILPSSSGLVARILNDRIAIKQDADIIQFSLPGGMQYGARLNVAEPERHAAPAADSTTVSNQKRLLYFSRWLAGLPDQYTEGRQILEKRLSNALPDDKPAATLDLARYELAHGYGAEALGYLEIAQDLAPALNRSAEYRALRGVGFALMGDGENAMLDLRDPALSDFPEIGMWRAYALAQQFDWDNAAKAIPQDTSALNDYPRRIQTPLILSISEVLLRAKNPQRAEGMLSLLDSGGKKPSKHEEAAISYLRGEAQRLRNQPVKAIELWNVAAKSNDQLYRVKAILAQTVLQMQQRAIKPDEAIERLEKLRFAWRGDGLETQIAQILGRLYMNNQKWDEAFELMRSAAGVAAGTQEGDAITASMTQSFSQLFTNPPKELKPLAAVSLYDRFPELVPPGEEGKAVMRGVADYLLQMDLLERAAGVYMKLLPDDKNGQEILHDGLQLTAIHLLAREPEKALETLQEAPVSTAKGTTDQERHRRLLAAKAFADLKRYDDAIKILEKVSAKEDSLSLIADTAWAAEKWDLAGRALNVLLTRSNPDMENLTDEQIALVFNQTVAFKLANDANAIANLRTKYLSAIKDKNKRTQFEVLTRPAQEITLADRQTLLNMAQEVDLFKSFLTQGNANPAETAVPTATPAKPSTVVPAETAAKPKE